MTNKLRMHVLGWPIWLIVWCSLVLSFAVNAETSLQWQHTTLKTQPSLRGSAMYGDSLWVSGSQNSVWNSLDGGKTWQDRSIKSDVITDFRDIALFDEQTAIVMGVGSGEQSVLYLTENAGVTWQLLYQNTDQTGFFDSIAFWDRQHGLLMGDPVDGYYVVKYTQDGGKTWQRVAKNKLPDRQEEEAAFAASGHTLIVGQDQQAWLTTGGKSASVYHSTDAGLSWARKKVPLFNRTATAGGYGLALNQNQQLFVVGGDYQQRDTTYPNMARFINNRWLSVASGQRGLRTAMKCVPAVCIATGKTGNDVSYDQGDTWQPLINPHSSLAGYYTAASDNNRFLLAGADGKIAIVTIL
ncbi:WD40/YVTN/BNR-like repeat-containing protein [Pseudoalteromonas ulvae]|uniref:Oxidoreductase n=1 Tax=Pseudoalteromonas ulvae TaxID=107327 RepID=A0A244CLH7_PSEDV|nr:YCF48-related protein [Pseudoalteromonas ulvae]OUL56452.1 oxidoreductase [Pseudoalteromonas ulvae]